MSVAELRIYFNKKSDARFACVRSSFECVSSEWQQKC